MIYWAAKVNGKYTKVSKDKDDVIDMIESLNIVLLKYKDTEKVELVKLQITEIDYD